MDLIEYAENRDEAENRDDPDRLGGKRRKTKRKEAKKSKQ